MSENLCHFDDTNFENDVEQAENLTIVDFWAEWCAPCKMIAPVVAELAKEYEGKVNIGKLNVDDSPKTATKFGVRGIPTLLFFKGGKVVQQLVGVKPKAEIQKIIDSNL